MFNVEIRKFALSHRESGTAVILFFLYAICYAYQITNFSISIDDEELVFSSSSQFVELGRWMHPLIRETFWPQVVTPFGPYLIFGVCICLGYVYLLKSFGLKKIELFHLAAFSGFILFPVWFAQLEFAGNVIPLGIGVLAISLATTLTLDAIEHPSGRIAALSSSALLVAIATGCYQSAILIFPVLVIGVAVYKDLILEDRISVFLRSILILIAVLLLSVAIYLVMARLVMLGYGIGPSKYGLSFVDPHAILTRPMAVMNAVVGDLQGMYFSWWKDYGAAPYVFSWVVIGGFAVLLISTARSSSR